ncbi:hypothetical protein PHYBOEH_011703 [Phytophthora boehmeriae]|uniref:Short chain dehydrogenase n=1 Tax=Phytophthora boehmeriae TaxID=109152 RepID=A0A8T1VFU9_9STRA|nr:hypothetical protein PHYBOEH_011703 [Phytophthora boehmeriae]
MRQVRKHQQHYSSTLNMAIAKKTVLITGSTRGIGLAFVEHYIKTGWNVIGTARSTSNTDKLKALSPFKIVTLDATDEASVLEAARQLEGVPIDLLINNAGIGLYTTFETASKDSFLKPFEVNVIGPFFLTRALLPNLQLAAKASGSAFVVQLSSIMASIASNSEQFADYFRGHYGYAASKAATNMVMRSLSMDLREHNIAVMSIHPGYVATYLTMGQGEQQPADSVAAMTAIIAKLSLKDTGKFFNADPNIDGSELPW